MWLGCAGSSSCFLHAVRIVRYLGGKQWWALIGTDLRDDSLVPVEDEDGEDVEGCLVEEATRYLSLRHAVQDVLHQFIRDVDLYIMCVCGTCGTDKITSHIYQLFEHLNVSSYEVKEIICAVCLNAQRVTTECTCVVTTCSN